MMQPGLRYKTSVYGYYLNNKSKKLDEHLQYNTYGMIFTLNRGESQPQIKPKCINSSAVCPCRDCYDRGDKYVLSKDEMHNIINFLLV